MERTKLILLHFASHHCHFAIIHPQIIHCSFMLFHFVVSENKFSLICLTFTGTLNQLHFTLLFMFTSFCTIMYFSFLSHCYYGAYFLLWLLHKLPHCTFSTISFSICYRTKIKFCKLLFQFSHLLPPNWFSDPALIIYIFCIWPSFGYVIHCHFVNHSSSSQSLLFAQWTTDFSVTK